MVGREDGVAPIRCYKDAAASQHAVERLFVSRFGGRNRFNQSRQSNPKQIGTGTISTADINSDIWIVFMPTGMMKQAVVYASETTVPQKGDRHNDLSFSFPSCGKGAKR